eukprot:6196512-Pleurochrysis_carterae.AAC.2
MGADPKNPVGSRDGGGPQESGRITLSCEEEARQRREGCKKERVRKGRKHRSMEWRRSSVGVKTHWFKEREQSERWVSGEI